MAYNLCDNCSDEWGYSIRAVLQIRGSVMQHLRWMCVLFLLAALSAGLAFSQAVNGSLLGTVTDSSGGSVPNARKTVTEKHTGFSRNTSTNQNGNYTFTDLPSGTCTRYA